MPAPTPFRFIAAALAFVVATATCVDAAETSCSSCTPPTGRLGYVWFTLSVGGSFTCVTGSQSMTQNYNAGFVGFKPDGTIGAIRFTDSAGAGHEVLISGGTACTVRA